MGADQSALGISSDFKKKTVSFDINGKNYTANPDKLPNGPDSLLVDYIRDEAGLKGTKYMCREGGCGACTVTVKMKNPVTGKDEMRAVNSCLIPVYRCDGMEITTVEHLGNVKTGLHPIQDRMVKFSATQCGFCTPGWVMNMHGLMESRQQMESKEIEDCMDGNICRCTGYRPILDAMKSFAIDASEELKRKCGSFGVCPCGPKGGGCGIKADNVLNEPEEDGIEEGEEAKETEEFDVCKEATPFHLSFKSGQQWVKATDLASLFTAIQSFQKAGLKYRIVGGNTGMGVYKYDGPFEAFVEVNAVPEITKVSMSPNDVTLGGAVTITSALEALKKASDMEGFAYCKEIVKHWSRVANTAVRNAGTLAGNLMLKNAHKEFPSDVFLLLEAIGAKISVATGPGAERQYSAAELIALDMNGKVITTISFPKLKNRYFRSFKVTRRYQNAHAYVNAAFVMKVDPKRRFSVREKPTIVFGGIAPNLVHAVGTEVYFVGKFLDEKSIQGAMAVLEKEIKPDHRPPDADPMYRKALAQALLYKFCLGILGDAASPMMKSGGTDIERGLSYGKQAYDTDKSQWPLYEPIAKIEAGIQCTGQAEYTNDICPEFGELHGAFVTTKVANANILKVDTSEAMKIPGVVDYVDAKDVPGTNNYMTMWDAHQPDEIFTSGKVSFAGQPVGMILAEHREIAIRAAKMVKVVYSNVQKPVLDIPTALMQAKLENKLEQCTAKVVNNYTEGVKLEDAPHSIKGEFTIGPQFHFQMEPYVTICVPREDQMDVYCATQWMSQVQAAIASALAMPINTINVQVRRLGGGFGSKVSRSTMVATACAVAANKHKRPVRMVLDIETALSTVGKRLPYLFQYEVGFDDSGKILNLNSKFFCEAGASANEVTYPIAFLSFQSCYSAMNWQLAPGNVMTNTAPNTYCRAPGSPQAIATMETIMEHIAHTLKKDPMEVRMANFMQKGDAIFGVPESKLEEDNPVPKLVEEIMSTADIADRQNFIMNFNKNNRWKKRGLAIQCMRYPIHYFFSGFNIFLAVCIPDATVIASHSGVEMGQGINTKVVQVIASVLCIPIEKIRIKPVNSLTAANTLMTGASTTSEHVCHSAVKACELLLNKLEPIKEKLGGDPKWEELIAEAGKSGLDLTSYYNTTYADKLKPYDVWGVAAAEAEIDCLTGEYKIVRVDLINDAGQSLSPEVDIGQTEGSFIMATGLWLTEKVQYDRDTGEVLTNRTWEYKPPLAKDIPEDFRVTLLKNSSNPHGVLRSKATGEAPFCLSYSVFLAIRKAIEAARMDVGNTDWFELHAPVTVEDIQRHCLTAVDQFKL